jgi:hypothetical protein
MTPRRNRSDFASRAKEVVPSWLTVVRVAADLIGDVPWRFVVPYWFPNFVIAILSEKYFGDQAALFAAVD